MNDAINSFNQGVSEEVQTLIRQLGTALPMMGAKNLVADRYVLTFSIGRNPKGISKVRIILTPADTYNVETFKGRGLNLKTAAAVTDVYADSLHATLESLTGLYTRL